MKTIENNPASAAEASETGASPLDAACARLKAAGLRMTRPRLAILTALAGGAEPATIEQIHARLTGCRCDRVTVYRSLAAFQDLGLARKTFLPDGTGLYSRGTDGRPRYHVAGRRTRRLGPIEGPEAEELSRALAGVEKALRDRGYTEVGHAVEFFGVEPAQPPAEG